MQLMHLKNSELEAIYQAYKARIVFRGDDVKDEEGAYAVFTEQGTSASHMTATKFLDVIARAPGNKGEDADATSAYTQILLSLAHEILGAEVLPETWISLPKNKQPKSWAGIEDPVCPLLRNLYGHPMAGLLWDKGSQRLIQKAGFEKVLGWESLYVHKAKQLFLGVYVDDFHMAGNASHMDEMWKTLHKLIQLHKPVPFSNKYLGCTQVDVDPDSTQVSDKKQLFSHRMRALNDLISQL